LVPFSLGRGIRQPQLQAFEGLCATNIYPFNPLFTPNISYATSLLKQSQDAQASNPVTQLEKPVPHILLHKKNQEYFPAIITRNAEFSPTKDDDDDDDDDDALPLSGMQLLHLGTKP
jgi:hypothetical protein